MADPLEEFEVMYHRDGDLLPEGWSHGETGLDATHHNRNGFFILERRIGNGSGSEDQPGVRARRGAGA